jgi:hypothetical protein
LEEVEAFRGSEAAPADEPVRNGVDESGAEVTPALMDDLRARMEEVRARLSALADEAQAGERPGVETVTVPADLLERAHGEIVATRALLAVAVDALAEDEDAEPRDAASPARDTACVVVLNMALNGAPRAEADRYVAENFDLPDADRIVAEAYAQCARMRAGNGAGHPA